ncbi:hypothetical protein M9C81_06735 [SAR86 cluster bacterium]|nr:hypothetical protein M9C81_06735 [SAR86 cluster bacterium]
MKARLFLILIFLCIALVITFNDSLNLFSPTEIEFLKKEITVNSEMMISFIAFFTMIFVLCIGMVEKLFYSRRAGKEKGKEE